MRSELLGRLLVGSVVSCMGFAAGATQDSVAIPPTNATDEAQVDLQAAAQPASRGREDASPQAEVSLYGMHLFSADFDNSPSDVSVTGGGAGLDFSIPVTERGTLTISASAEYWNYDFSNGNAFFPLADTTLDGPWEDIYVGTVGMSWSNKIHDKWGYRVGFEITSSGETGADFSDTLTYGGFIGATYAINQDFAVGFGVGVQTQLEDDALFVPVPIIQWRINDQWSITTKRVGNLGGLAVNYAVCDTITLSLMGGYERNSYRLDDEGILPDGVGRHSGIPVVLNIAWTASSQIELNAWGGYLFAQEYELIDTDENSVAKVDADAAAMVGFGATFKF